MYSLHTLICKSARTQMVMAALSAGPPRDAVSTPDAAWRRRAVLKNNERRGVKVVSLRPLAACITWILVCVLFCVRSVEKHLFCSQAADAFTTCLARAPVREVLQRAPAALCARHVYTVAGLLRQLLARCDPYQKKISCCVDRRSERPCRCD